MLFPRKSTLIVSGFAGVFAGIVGVGVVLYAWNLPQELVNPPGEFFGAVEMVRDRVIESPEKREQLAVLLENSQATIESGAHVVAAAYQLILTLSGITIFVSVVALLFVAKGELFEGDPGMYPNISVPLVNTGNDDESKESR